MIFLPFHSWTNVSLCPHNSEAFVTLLSVTVRKDFNFLLALVSLSLVTDVWSCDPLTYWVREWVSEWATHAVSLCAPPPIPNLFPRFSPRKHHIWFNQSILLIGCFIFYSHCFYCWRPSVFICRDRWNGYELIDCWSVGEGGLTKDSLMPGFKTWPQINA